MNNVNLGNFYLSNQCKSVKSVSKTLPARRSRRRSRVLILSKIIGSLLVSFTNGALQNDPVDEGGWFSQVLAARKTAAEYILLTKSSILSSCLKAGLAMPRASAHSAQSASKNSCNPWLFFFTFPSKRSVDTHSAAQIPA